MPSTYLPLRWECTGDRWWFASPIDWAAANGHYKLVRELLHIDTNNLIKLTSLPRIQRLETVWDDEENFSVDVAKCRSRVAQKLLQDSETKKEYKSLIRAGYGGWLLYTAASAGDMIFVKELLDSNPLLVFGEGEYGVTDMFYAAARSKNWDMFKLLFDFSLSPVGQLKESSSVFRSEMMNRAVHAAARGGSVEILRELLGDHDDILAFRDAKGSTLLHSASGRGQLEIVKHLISSYDIFNSLDNQSNSALHVAAYFGHLPVLEILLSASPSSASLTNNHGDTFLHMAISGFSSPSFRRLDRHTQLMKQLVSSNLVNLEEIINVQNNDGRTALHLAVIHNIQANIVELLMSVRYINLAIRDADGKTPLDLLKQWPHTASSDMLMKRLISAGGISDCRDENARKALVSHMRKRGIGGSPGTSFSIPDAEILSYTGGVEGSGRSSCDYNSTNTNYSGELNRIGSTAKAMNRTTSRLKNILHWPPRRRTGNADAAPELEDSYSVESYATCTSSKDSPVPLRQQLRKNLSSLQNLPSPSTKKRFAAGLTHGVLQLNQKRYFGSPSSAFSESSWSSNVSAENGKKNVEMGEMRMKRKHASFNIRIMNNYICFGAHGLAVEKSISQRPRTPYGSNENLM